MCARLPFLAILASKSEWRLMFDTNIKSKNKCEQIYWWILWISQFLRINEKNL